MNFDRNLIFGALAAGVGGAGGALARWCWLGNGDEMGDIFMVNVIGSLLFGFIMRMLRRRYTLSQRWTDFLLSGFCGGLTTFSSLAAVCYFRIGDIAEILFYIAFQTIMGVLALMFGAWIATKTIKIG